MEQQFRAAPIHAKTMESARISRISVLINVLAAQVSSEKIAKNLFRVVPSPARTEVRVPIRPISVLTPVLALQVLLE